MSKTYSFSSLAAAVKNVLDDLAPEQRVSTIALNQVICVKYDADPKAVQAVLTAIVSCEGNEEIGRYFHREKAVAQRGKNAGKTMMRAIWHRPYPLELKGAA